MEISVVILDFLGVILLPKNHPDVRDRNFLSDPTGSFVLNEDILDFFHKKYVSKEVNIYIFSDTKMQTTDWFFPKIEWVSHWYHTFSLGVHKFEKEAYKELELHVHGEPNRMLFIDDKIENVHAAEQAGYATHQYKNNDTLFSFCKTIFI